MAEAGGRLFVDVTQPLGTRAGRAGLIGMVGKSDPLVGDALQTIVDRGDFVPLRPDEASTWAPPGAGSAAIVTSSALVAELSDISQASIATLSLPPDGPAAESYDARPGTAYLMRPDGHVAARARQPDVAPACPPAGRP